MDITLTYSTNSEYSTIKNADNNGNLGSLYQESHSILNNITGDRRIIETLDTQETKETSQWNENAFSGEMPPSAGIREILGKTINIIDRKIFRVKFDPVKNTFDTPDSEGMITKYMVVTKQKLPITIKDKLQQVSNWYVSKGHYDQLNKLSPDGKSDSLKQMETYPEWILDTVNLYTNKEISDDEFLEMTKYLIEERIIRIAR